MALHEELMKDPEYARSYNARHGFAGLSKRDRCTTVHFRYFLRLTTLLGIKPPIRGHGPVAPLGQLRPLQRRWLYTYSYGGRMRGGLRR